MNNRTEEGISSLKNINYNAAAAATTAVEWH